MIHFYMENHGFKHQSMCVSVLEWKYMVLALANGRFHSDAWLCIHAKVNSTNHACMQHWEI